jgi:hypothetical protein
VPFFLAFAIVEIAFEAIRLCIHLFPSSVPANINNKEEMTREKEVINVLYNVHKLGEEIDDFELDAHDFCLTTLDI